MNPKANAPQIGWKSSPNNRGEKYEHIMEQ